MGEARRKAIMFMLGREIVSDTKTGSELLDVIFEALMEHHEEKHPKLYVETTRDLSHSPRQHSMSPLDSSRPAKVTNPAAIVIGADND